MANGGPMKGKDGEKKQKTLRAEKEAQLQATG